MIKNLIDHLEIAKKINARGKFIDIALGKYKLPTSILEGLKQIKYKL
jgi:hypothetical protein|tara:strand:- start:3597 stop:3737 length:141 start_codon:yes stop_codon:yes gene_type:complete